MEGFSLELRQAGSLLGNQGFRRLWIAQFSTTTAVYGLSLGAVALIEEQTQSSAWTALTILSAILPAFLGSLISGAVVDRLGRVRVLIGSHLARTLVALAFWAIVELVPPEWIPITIFATTAVMALMTQFALPAELALLPDLVDDARLTAANALLQLSVLAAEGLGIIFLSPLVIKLLGVSAIGLLGAMLCGLAVFLVLPLSGRVPQVGRPVGRGVDWAALRTDLQAGWRTIARDRVLLLVTLQATLAATLLLVLMSLLPGLVSRHWDLGVEDAPFVLLPGGLGFVLGAVLIARIQGRLRQPIWIALGLTILGSTLGLLTVLSGQAGSLWLSLPLIFGIGLSLAMIVIPARVVLQRRPPASMRGRVIAAQLALANAASALPVLLGGSLADQLGIQPVMGLLSLVAIGTGVLGFYYARS